MFVPSVCVFVEVDGFMSKGGHHMSHAMGVNVDLVILIYSSMLDELFDDLLCSTDASEIRICEGHHFVVRKDVGIAMS